MIEAAILVIFPFCMAFSIVSDTLSMTIANRVSLLLIAGFAILAPMTGMAWSAYGLHFAAAMLVLAVTFSLFSIGAMGGGDAKLMAATALWIGLELNLLSYLVYAAMIGGALTFMILLFRKSPMAVYAGQVAFLRRIADPKEGVPYGIALGAAALIVFPQTPLCIWALERITLL